MSWPTSSARHEGGALHGGGRAVVGASGQERPHPEGAAADRIIKADERKFIDLQRSAIQFTKERVFIDHVRCEI